VKRQSIKMQRQLFTPAEIAEAYGLNTGTLANLRCKRQGPRFYRIQGAGVRYNIRDIEDWLATGKIETFDSHNANS